MSEAEPVHLITHQVAPGGGRVVTHSKCGATSERNTQTPLPPTFTGWWSRVTCTACILWED